MPLVTLETRDRVATVTFNRPESLNALNQPMRTELAQALEAAGRDSEVRAILLTGAGRAFSVGQDLSELEGAYAHEGPQLGRLVHDEWGPLVRTLRTLPKPVIAAVNGAAAGGGLSLALACDLRVAEPRTQFLPAFVNVGLAPDSGAAHMLVRAVGSSKAMEVLMRGTPIRAEEARTLGLVAEIAESGEALMERATALAMSLAGAPPLALAAIKEIVHNAEDTAFTSVVDLEARLQDILGRSDDHREGVRAFGEKRKAAYVGR